MKFENVWENVLLEIIVVEINDHNKRLCDFQIILHI
jgi:hypothetical protein